VVLSPFDRFGCSCLGLSSEFLYPALSVSGLGSVQVLQGDVVGPSTPLVCCVAGASLQMGFCASRTGGVLAALLAGSLVLLCRLLFWL
jgi:hypothetical protein